MKILADSRQSDINNEQINIKHKQAKASGKHDKPLGRYAFSHEGSLQILYDNLMMII
jgi:hypothetical protein